MNDHNIDGGKTTTTGSEREASNEHPSKVSKHT
jgi:hypothetical protein